MKTKIKKQTKNPRLLKERRRLIMISGAEGFLSYEVAEIFRITESRVSQIIKKVGTIKKKK